MPRIKNLSPKMEKFCQNVASGMSYKDSYLSAYDCNSDKAAFVESTKLAARSDIQNRIAALLKPVEQAIRNEAISERDKKKRLIHERIQACIAKDDDTAIARYLDILNKMDAEYININRNIEDKQAEIVNLDTETLKKLSGAS